MGTSFKDAIREHLELKESNRWIEQRMPLSRWPLRCRHGQLRDRVFA